MVGVDVRIQSTQGTAQPPANPTCAFTSGLHPWRTHIGCPSCYLYWAASALELPITAYGSLCPNVLVILRELSTGTCSAKAMKTQPCCLFGQECLTIRSNLCRSLRSAVPGRTLVGSAEVLPSLLIDSEHMLT